MYLPKIGDEVKIICPYSDLNNSEGKVCEIKVNGHKFAVYIESHKSGKIVLKYDMMYLEPLTSVKKCTCNLDQIMTIGCTCGGK